MYKINIEVEMIQKTEFMTADFVILKVKPYGCLTFIFYQKYCYISVY